MTAVERSFLRLEDSQLEEAYGLLQRVFAHLKVRGRRQRISKTTWETYSRWQLEKANYGVHESGALVGLVTLRYEVLDDWPDYRPLGSVRMIRALATHPDHLGQGVGAFTVAGAVSRCDRREEIFLDCVSDFLPGYYRTLGFEQVCETERNWPGEPPFSISLMRYRR